MFRARSTFVYAIVTPLLFLACEGAVVAPDDAPTVDSADGGAEATADGGGGTDAPVDARGDARVDAGGPDAQADVDAGALAADAGDDAYSESDADAAFDAGSDAGSAADADAGPPSAFRKVFVGGYHACALQGGKLWCWGNNMAGQLGLGTADSNAHGRAVRVPNIDDVVDVTMGRYGTCVRTAPGAIKCWGLNTHRQLGVDNAADTACSIFGGGHGCRLTPIPLTFAGAVKKLTIGFSHACALVTEGGVDKVRCWGGDDYGQLGPNAADATCTAGGANYLCSETKTDIGIALPTDLSAGYDHGAALTSAGSVLVWGRNTAGQLGQGAADANPHRQPTTAPSVTAASLPLRASSSHLCAVTTAGPLTCWGRNDVGQTGQPSAPFVMPASLALSFTAVALGDRHTCLRTATATVACFGENSSRELGRDLGAGIFSTAQAADVAGLTNVTSFSAGGFHSCAVRGDDSVHCWGRNRHGESGTDPAVDPAPLTQVQGIGEN